MLILHIKISSNFYFYTYMAKHIDLGKIGEKLATDYLIGKGYRILEQNYRYRRSEADIICIHDDILVFVEVKSRSSDIFGNPENFVTRRKEELLYDLASHYMEEIDHQWEIRFDIISIIFHKNGINTIEHFEDAFFWGW